MANVPRKPVKHVPVLVEAGLARLGERIRLARKARGMTMEDLATLSDVSIATVRALESGGDGVSTGNLLKVMKGLDMLQQIEQLMNPQHDPEMVAYAQRRLGAR